MSERGEGGDGRRARRGRVLVPALAAALLLVLPALAAVMSSGCGGPSDPGAGVYLGAWERVVAGRPDPSLTLLVERTADGARLTFADDAGPGGGGVATLEGGLLVMKMPAANGILEGATGLQLSLDESGQLVVDRVLADGTAEPVWVYERGASAAPAPAP